MDNKIDTTRVIAESVAWLEKAVIGLNLCPFARAAHVGSRVRWVVSDAVTPDALLADLQRELEFLAEADPAKLETTLLVHPRVLGDFLDFNDFLEVAEAAVEALDLEGVIQVASFHPQYRFKGSGADDIDNYTNRSPYPMLHLLREDSIERAVESHPETDSIWQQNVDTLRRLGHEGWRRLWISNSDEK